MRTFKRIFTVTLCAVLIVCAFAGCKDTDPEVTPSGVVEDIDPSASPSTITTTLTRDYKAIYALHSPDYVVATVNGAEIRWQEYYYSLYNMIISLENSFGTVPNWDAEIVAGMTYSDYMKDSAMSYCIQDKIKDAKAAEFGLELNDDDYAAIESSWEAKFTVDPEAEEGAEGPEFISEEAFVAYLESIFDTEEMYRERLARQRMESKVFEYQFGVLGADVSDADVLEFAGDEYMMAKHILFATNDMEGVALSEDEKAQKYAAAQDVLEQLQSYSGDDIEAFFDEFVFEHTEDPGVIYFPTGYLFKTGQMVPQFEEAVKSVEEYEVAGIVETDSGYHIVLRLPVNPGATPIEYQSYVYYGYGAAYTLRYQTAVSMYNSLLDSWFADADLQWVDEMAELNLGDILS